MWCGAKLCLFRMSLYIGPYSIKFVHLRDPLFVIFCSFLLLIFHWINSASNITTQTYKRYVYMPIRYCFFHSIILKNFGGRGPTRWGLGAEGRGPRVEDHKHPRKFSIHMKFSIYLISAETSTALDMK